jgi:ketosteroid isomerase-like protein
VDDSDVIAALFQAFAERDVETAMALSDPELEFWPKVIMVLAGREGPYIGHQGIREYFEDIAKIFDRVAIEVTRMRVVEGGAAVFGVSRGTTAGGQEIEAPLMVVGRLRKGKVIYARSHATLDEAEAELGGADPGAPERSGV